LLLKVDSFGIFPSVEGDDGSGLSPHPSQSNHSYQQADCFGPPTPSSDMNVMGTSYPSGTIPMPISHNGITSSGNQLLGDQASSLFSMGSPGLSGYFEGDDIDPSTKKCVQF
jgi:hypothetical protein